jgi:uncharacterized RDD family membrane protein YckC
MRAMSVQELVPRRPRYADPTGRYTAEFASPWRRASAGAIDWGLCLVAYLVVSIPLGAVQALGSTSEEDGDLGGIPGHALVISTQILTAAPAIAYFALLLPTSHTLGMRARDIRLVSLRTGQAPSRLASALRAAGATAVAAALYVLLFYWTSFETIRHLDTASRVALDAAYVLGAAAGVSAVAMIVTPTHRNGFDRLFGTAVLDQLEAVSPVMGPWGPLDSFDLAHKRGSARRLSLPAR